MIPRDIARSLRDAARHYPVVTLVGPRQSGKSTVCAQAFPAKRVVSFEPLDRREQARRDPRGGATPDPSFWAEKPPLPRCAPLFPWPAPVPAGTTGSSSPAVRSAVLDQANKRTVGIDQICDLEAGGLDPRRTEPWLAAVLLEQTGGLARVVKAVELVESEAAAERALERIEIGKRKEFERQGAALQDHPSGVAPALGESERAVEVRGRFEIPRRQVRGCVVGHSARGNANRAA